MFFAPRQTQRFTKCFSNWGKFGNSCHGNGADEEAVGELTAHVMLLRVRPRRVNGQVVLVRRERELEIRWRALTRPIYPGVEVRPCAHDPVLGELAGRRAPG